MTQEFEHTPNGKIRWPLEGLLPDLMQPHQLERIDEVLAGIEAGTAAIAFLGGIPIIHNPQAKGRLKPIEPLWRKNK